MFIMSTSKNNIYLFSTFQSQFLKKVLLSDSIYLIVFDDDYVKILIHHCHSTKFQILGTALKSDHKFSGNPDMKAN